MKVYIYGCLGNMGKRYSAILESLGHQWAGEDTSEDDLCGDEFILQDADAVIVATPTNTHVGIIRSLKRCGKPILCEKPITKDLAELETLIEELQLAGTRLEMVSQYDHLKLAQVSGKPTIYNYFKHGGDGIRWDCINIIKHANDLVILREDSPVWQCQINGKRLSLADMDQAYVDMIERWLMDPRDDLNPILEAHRKVHEMEVSTCRES